MDFCEGDLTKEKMKAVHRNMRLVYNILLAVQQIIWLCSLYIIFVHNYRRKKQTFVKVIWLFISLAEILQAVICYILLPEINSD